jgi:transcriptional regulator with XRE-family HTH domain
VPPRTGVDPVLPDALRSLREGRGYTQEQLAHDAGLTVAGYRKIERAQVNPTWTTLRRITKALGLTHAELGREIDARDVA